MRTRARSWSVNTSVLVPRRAGREAATGGPPRVGVGEGVDEPAGPALVGGGAAHTLMKYGKRHPEKYAASMITF